MSDSVVDQALEILVAGQDFIALRRALFATVAGHYLENKSSAAPQSDQEDYRVFALNALLARLPTRTLASVATIAKGKTGIKDAVRGPFPLVVTAEARGSSDHFDFEGPGVMIPMVSSTGHGDASLKRVHFQDGQYAVGSILAVVQPKDSQQLSARYLHAYLSTFKDELLVSRMVGTANVSLTIAKIGDVPVPLLPISAQRKVDELMALCDRLEAQQADAESAHTQLVQALLDSLTQASDATDFAANWQRLTEHFHTLFTTEPSIEALKHTLLQLAVMGKLAPQDPSDESADKLLKRISDHRSTYREKKQKSLADISEVEKPFELPCQWAWTTLPAIGELARGKSRHRPRNDPSLYAGGNIPLIQTGDVARANGVVKTHSAMYNAKGVEQSRLWPAGTMCITIAANIADSATLGFDACFPDSVVGFIPEFPELDVRYFEFFLRTAKSHLEDFAPSTAQKNINLEILGLLSVPLPPANEVRRIVAKVDQLMALCDQLKTRLTQARQMNEQLASTLVEQAVA